MFLEFSKDPLNGFYDSLAGVFALNQNVIEVHNDKNIKFFCKNFIDVALEAAGGVKKTKRHDLVLKMAVPRSDGCFLLVTLPNSYSIICICQVQLSKTLGVTYAIEQLTSQR